MMRTAGARSVRPGGASRCWTSENTSALVASILSSRWLPGHGCEESSASAALLRKIEKASRRAERATGLPKVTVLFSSAKSSGVGKRARKPRTSGRRASERSASRSANRSSSGRSITRSRRGGTRSRVAGFSRMYRSCRKRPSCTSSSRSRLVAAMSLGCAGRGLPSPSRVTCPRSRTRRSCRWRSRSRFAISSRKSVPPWACSKTPAWSSTAPVYEPRREPKRCDGRSALGTVERSVTTRGPLAPERGCSTCSARKLLPVPVSPWTSTGSGERASTPSFCRSSLIPGARPQKTGPSCAACCAPSARVISKASVRLSTMSFSQKCTSGSLDPSPSPAVPSVVVSSTTGSRG